MSFAKLALYPDTDTVPTLVGITPYGNGDGFYRSAAAYGDYVYVVVRVPSRHDQNVLMYFPNTKLGLT